MLNETRVTWTESNSKERMISKCSCFHFIISLKMVRFHWICDGGQNSFVPPSGVKIDEQNGVTHVSCEMEVSVQTLNLIDV